MLGVLLDLGAVLGYILNIFFRGCYRQPLYCFQIDIFLWLHVTDIMKPYEHSR